MRAALRCSRMEWMGERDEPWELELCRAVLAGDERAWRELHDRHARALWRYVSVRARALDAHRQEEIVQDCWVVAVKRIGAFDPRRASFWSWLRGIADGTLANHSRRWGLRSRTERPLADEGVAAGERRDALADRELLELALSALPPHYQGALEARYQHGLSVPEIAAARGATPKSIESQLSRARTALRAELARLGEPARAPSQEQADAR